MRPRGDCADRLNLADALVATGEHSQVAFRRVYQLSWTKLFAICLRVCPNRQTAEDVLHDVYLVVWRRASAYERNRGSAIAWLSLIAYNRSIDQLRAAGKWRSRPLEAASQVKDSAPLAFDEMLNNEANRRLHLALDTLERHQRAAIRSAFFGGATYAELAKREGVPLGTMKSWIRRGLAKLNESLRDDD